MSCCCNCAQASAEALQKAGIDVTLLQPVLDKYGAVEGSLITILQNAQEIYGYLPIELLNYIAIKTGNKPAKVLGVATFYAQFRLQPVGKYLIMLCQGTACHVNGSEAIETAICEELNVKEGETTPDGLFTLNNVACLGCCSLSPVMMINGETYGSLTPAKAKSIIADIRAKEAEAK
jgi:NADH-quinone oxidoreductase subunit E